MADKLPKSKKVGREYIIRGVLLDDDNPSPDVDCVVNFIAIDLNEGVEMRGNLKLIEFKQV